MQPPRHQLVCAHCRALGDALAAREELISALLRGAAAQGTPEASRSRALGLSQAARRAEVCWRASLRRPQRRAFAVVCTPWMAAPLRAAQVSPKAGGPARSATREAAAAEAGVEAQGSSVSPARGGRPSPAMHRASRPSCSAAAATPSRC